MKHQLKITGEYWEEALRIALNLASAIAHGYMLSKKVNPTNDDLYHPGSENTYNLWLENAMHTSDVSAWAYVRDKGENFILLEFHREYENKEKEPFNKTATLAVKLALLYVPELDVFVEHITIV